MASNTFFIDLPNANYAEFAVRRIEQARETSIGYIRQLQQAQPNLGNFGLQMGQP